MPSQVAPALLPRIVTPNTMPALTTSAGSCGWRFTGVDVTAAPSVTVNFAGLITIGTGNETALGQ